MDVVEKYGELVGAMKIIYVWANNPSQDVLRDIELIKSKAEEALTKVVVLEKKQ